MRKLAAALLAAGLFAACGDDGHDVTPTIITGGGIHDPGIDGEVNVYVIDEDTDAPLTGANVRVGDVEGTTDATGLFVATGDGLKGKQTIVAKATSYAASMWVGVDGANVTIGLTRASTTVADLPQAELAGTIAGWDTLTAPATNHVLIALVEYSQSKDLGDDDANSLPQPTGTGGLPANACVRGATGPNPPCAWRVNARAGTVGLLATILDVDTKGTATQDDDTNTTIGFAIKQPITVADNANQTGITLDQLTGAPTSASVSFGTPPTGLTNHFGIVGIDLGSAGVIRSFLNAATTTDTSITVPSLASISGASYEFLGVAEETTTDPEVKGSSIVLRRGITSAASFSAGEWLVPPAGLASDRAMVSLTPAAGADLSIIEIDSSNGTDTGNRAMSIAIFDATTTVVLPVDFAPLPSGPLVVSASGIETDAYVANDFEVEAVLDQVARLAGEKIKLN